MCRTLLILSFLCVVLPAIAQDSACENALDKAKLAYSNGKVKDVKTLLTEDCIKQFPQKESVQEAYYLLCTASLFLNDKEKASEYMLKLLRMQPEYRLQPNMPMEFKQFYEEFIVAPVLLVGIKVGGNINIANPLRSFAISNMLPESNLGKYNVRYGFQGGLVVQRPLNKKFDVGLEGLFRISGYQYNNKYLEYINITFTETQRFLELPLYIKYNFKNKFNFSRDMRFLKNKIFPYISVGTTFSMLSKSSGVALRLDQGADTAPLTLESDPFDMKAARHTNKIMPMGALGVEYKSGRTILSLEVRYNRMLNTQVRSEMRYANQELLLKYGHTDNDFRLHNLAISLNVVQPFYHARYRKTQTSAKPKIIDIKPNE